MFTNPDYFYMLLWVMAGLAVVVFVALQRVEAGYGMLYKPGWGPSVGNRLGWVVMESPVFFAMLALWLLSPRRGEIAPAVMALLFELHYFQRSFLFPMLIRGRNRMPLAIVVMGVVFNLVNALMQGGWIFYVSPATRYPVEWLWSPQFIVGTLMFFAGMYINIDSDRRIRMLRKPGDTGHYIPMGGMFRYVSSANYFGEVLEWTGFAVLTWSWSGAVFALWTFANLAPRAMKTYHRYCAEFGTRFTSLHRKKIIPFIY